MRSGISGRQIRNNHFSSEADAGEHGFTIEGQMKEVIRTNGDFEVAQAFPGKTEVAMPGSVNTTRTTVSL